MFGSDFEVDAWSRFLRWNLIKICVWTCDINSILGSVVPLAMFIVLICRCNIFCMFKTPFQEYWQIFLYSQTMKVGWCKVHFLRLRDGWRSLPKRMNFQKRGELWELFRKFIRFDSVTRPLWKYIFCLNGGEPFVRLPPSLPALSVRDYLFILFQFLVFVLYIMFWKNSLSIPGICVYTPCCCQTFFSKILLYN